jgi:hypothetical protein
MKCIKVVKETKDNKIGTIRRVADSEADTKVSSKVWAFCPKSEWKLATRKPKSVQVTDQATDQATDQVELSIEEKKLARKKTKK